jgi:hypothetical protein
MDANPCLLYLVFGAETYHKEALYSIASAFSFIRHEQRKMEIRVITDCPTMYRALPVTIRELDANTRFTWCQPHGYHFRMKHVALRETLKTTDKAILIDSDTFFLRSPWELFDRVKPGVLLCNYTAGCFGDIKNTTTYQSLSGYLKERQLVDDKTMLTNSGVIGLHNNDKIILDNSISLMDDLFLRGKNIYALEEFCLAIAAHNKIELKGCRDVIFHYWSRKDIFRAKILAWLNKHGSNLLSDMAMGDVENITSELPRPEGFYRFRNKILISLFGSKRQQFTRELLYGCYAYKNEFDRACCTVWWEKAAKNALHRKTMDRAALEAWFEAPSSRRLVKLCRGELSDIHDHLHAQGIL